MDNIAHLEEDDPQFSFVREDVVRAPLMPVDLVLHLASPASPVHYQRFAIETMLANSAGTHRLAAIASDAGARFVFASTSEVYGDPLEHPQRETYWGNVNPIGPRACYDESKRFGEALTLEYRRKHGINASIVRIFNTYGPRMNLAGRPRRAGVRRGGAARDSRCRSSATASRRARSATCRTWSMRCCWWRSTASADGEVFNLGNPHEVTMLELGGRRSRARRAMCRRRVVPAGGAGRPRAPPPGHHRACASGTDGSRAWRSRTVSRRRSRTSRTKSRSGRRR